MFSKRIITQDITAEQRELIEFPLLPKTYAADSRRSSNDSEIRPASEQSAETNKDINENETFSNVVKKTFEGNIPKPPVTSVDNHFGLNGLLSCIRSAESYPDLVSLAMGLNLEELGLNLNTPETLYHTFSGPFSDRPCRIHDIEYHVPPEYLVNFLIRDELGPLNLAKLKDDAIFFLFYGCVGDFIQLICAAELYYRNWRFYIEERVWLTRVPGVNNYIKNGTMEKGTYYYFDPRVWRRVAKEFEFDADKLEKCPTFNAPL